MSEVFPNVGLTALNNYFPRGVGAPATLYLGLFVNFTASTVGDKDCAIGSIVEPSAGGYARVPIPAASWGAAASIASGVIATAAQTSFAESTAQYSPTNAVNGWFLIDTASGSGVLLGMSNFTDSSGVEQPPVIVNQSGITVSVTPAWKRTN